MTDEEEREGRTEDLFEDLDKFFAPIKDVDWPGSEESGKGSEPPTHAAPEEEHVKVHVSDPSARREAWGLVRGLSDLGKTILLTTHYMEEAQALADRVAVIAAGHIVAGGTPDSLGGRDTADAVVRFHLPDATVPADIPVPGLADVETGHEGEVTFSTSDPIKTLHELTGWALDRGVHLAGLTVTRPSLEDVYLQITGSDEAKQ